MKIPARLTAAEEHRNPDLDRMERRRDRKARRRRIRSQGWSGDGRAAAGRRSGPGTPLLRWKFDDGDVSIGDDGEGAAEVGRRGRRKVRGGGGYSPVSARKLAAGLWHLRVPAGGGGGGRDGGGLIHRRLSGAVDQVQSGVGDVVVPVHGDGERRELVSEPKELLESPFHDAGRKNGFLCKAESSLSLSNSAMEGVTKWDPVCSKTLDTVHWFNDQTKALGGQQITVSAIATLQTELEEARVRIHELEMERRSSKKKFENFLSKLAEEKCAWQSREHQKIRVIIDDIKDELNRERKNRQRAEIINSKLVNEFAEVKLSAKRLFQDYEKERKSRELMEEVCDELAKEIGEDKTEVDVLKRDSLKFREEVEEERRMLQMAEVWREERVQMKLVDAKLTLEHKYAQMSKLIKDLEVFLRSRSATPDMTEMREAEQLLEAANSMSVQDIKEFTYEPPNTEDIFAVFEDHQNGEINEREIEQCPGYSPASRVSEVRTVSLGRNEDSEWRYPNYRFSHNRNIEDEGSVWETVSQADEQGSSYSAEESDPSVNKNRRDSNVSISGKGWEENAIRDSPDTEISEICSISARQSKKKSSTISRLWRSNGETLKIISAEGINGKISNGRFSTGGIISPDRRSGEGVFSPPNLMGQWSSPDSGNPHISRGMKGCIDWPRIAQKNSLKAKLLEARMESQKVQLRQVLKQKI
ncbi:hypothetical protein Scep_012943 [Stephania cephalantha]|uniref:Uncharacterized protein n=1 Tax=Stephania cephalantha TaxID=152367 RepID=A0AAP0JGW7_9MAGN